MKKLSLETIRTALTDLGYDNAEILAEIDAEINRNEEEKAARAAAYEEIHNVVVGTLSDIPVTCSELWDSISNDVPDGITKGKVQYALNNLWQNEIEKIPGKPNTYRRK